MQGVVLHMQEGHLTWQNQLWKGVMQTLKHTEKGLKHAQEVCKYRPLWKAKYASKQDNKGEDHPSPS